MSLPGVCIVCREPVEYRAKRWRVPGARLGRVHECPAERAACGRLMPRARERCARRPGHTTECRTRYAMDNAARRWTSGVASVIASAQNDPSIGAVGVVGSLRPVPMQHRGFRP
jgi:hypothetical protein